MSGSRTGAAISTSPASPTLAADLVSDHLTGLLQSPQPPRTGGVFDATRRAATELGVFLEIDAPEAGHDPRLIDGEHLRRFVADQRRRERDGLPSLAMKRPDGSASIVTTTTRSLVFNAVRKLLRDASDDGAADRIGLGREFVVAAPAAGRQPANPTPPVSGRGCPRAGRPG